MPSSPAVAALASACPEDWQVLPLADVAYFQEGPGILAKDFRETGIPLLRLKGVEGDYVTLDGCNYLEPEMVARKWSHFRVEAGDLLISTSASLGRVSVVTTESAGGIPYTGLIRFKPKDERLLAGYLKAFLGSSAFVEQAESMASGSVIRHFGPSHIRQMAILLPPLDQQSAIGQVASLLDERLRLLRQTNATLESIAQALFKSWFIDFDPVRAKAEGREPEGMDAATVALFPSEFEESALGLIPKGWRVGDVYNLAEVRYGAPFASKLFNTEGNGLPLVRIRDLKDEAPGVWTPEVHPKGCKVYPGDIVVGMDGEFRAYLWGGEVAWMNQRICMFKPANGHSAAFVRSAIAAPLAHIEATETATTVIHLGKGDIDRFQVVVPPPGVASAFSALCQPIYDRMVAGKQVVRSLARVRDTLLPRLISGKLRIPEAQEQVEDALA